MNQMVFGDATSNQYDKQPVDFESAITSSTPESRSVEIEMATSLPSEQMPSELFQAEPPHPDLMGMMLDGIETVEYPTGSGAIWVRSSPDLPWEPKA